MQTHRLDAIYRALGDPSRRAMLQRLAHAPSLTVSELAAPLPLAMPTVLKHLDVLERAALVCRHKTGRTVSVTLQPATLVEAMAMSWSWEDEDAPASRVQATFKPVGAGHTELTFVHARLQDDATRNSHEQGWHGALDKLQRKARRLS